MSKTRLSLNTYLREGKMKSLSYDIENMRPQDFKRKYGKTAKEMLADKSLEDDCGCDDSIEEAADGSLAGSNLVDHLSSICMSTWFSVTSDFKANPDQYDIQPNEAHDSYNVLKMTPGNDVIGSVYEKITGTTMKLSSDLNKAFGKEIFEPRISRSDGNLETLVGFSNSSGGVFQCKATSNGGDSTVYLTMPNEEQLGIAFSAMTETPHAGDGQDLEAPEETPVAGEPVPEFDADSPQDLPSEEPTDAEFDDPQDIQYDEEPFAEGVSTEYKKRRQAERIGKKVGSISDKDKRRRSNRRVTKTLDRGRMKDIYTSSKRAAESQFEHLDRLSVLKRKGFRSIGETKELNHLSAQYRIWKKRNLEEQAEAILLKINEGFFGEDVPKVEDMDIDTAQRYFDKYAGDKKKVKMRRKLSKRIDTLKGKTPIGESSNDRDLYKKWLKNKNGKFSPSELKRIKNYHINTPGAGDVDDGMDFSNDYRKLSKNEAMETYTIVLKDRDGEQTTASLSAASESEARSEAKKKFRNLSVVSISQNIGEASDIDFASNRGSGEYKVKKAGKYKKPPISILPDTEEDTIEQSDANIAVNRKQFKKRTRVNEDEQIDEVSRETMRFAKRQAYALGGKSSRQAKRLGKKIADRHLRSNEMEREVVQEPEGVWKDLKLDVINRVRDNNQARAERIGRLMPGKKKLQKSFEKGAKAAGKEAVRRRSMRENTSKVDVRQAYTEAKEAESELMDYAQKFHKFSVKTTLGDTVVLTVKAKKESKGIDFRAKYNESKQIWAIRVTHKGDDTKNVVTSQASPSELYSTSNGILKKLCAAVEKEEPVEEEASANSVSSGGVDLAPSSGPRFMTLRRHGFTQGPFG